MSHEHYSPASVRWCLAGLILILAAYGAGACAGWPQYATSIISGGHAAVSVDDHESTPAEETHTPPAPPSYFATIPFFLLLAGIAILPLIPATEHWWESNLHRFLVACALALCTLAYYTFLHHSPIERHFVFHGEVAPQASGASWHLPWVVIQNAILGEYIPFIVLLFSLFTICGGIRITGDLPAHPLTNTIFILIGGVLASFIGTTGAAMVMIRLLLETNRERKHVAHTIVFFILVVCNCGGCLLPIGDPPLFLGYLQGVPFLWTMSLLPQWAFVNLSLLVIYFLWDHFFAYPRETRRDIASDEAQVRKLTFSGLIPNVPLLLGVVLAVALLDPTKAIPGTNWHAWLWLREVVQLALVAISLGLGAEAARRENRFNFAPIIEVAALFVGIFICMQPALQILNVQGAALGLDTPAKFFWVTGSLSAVLDNAPTYLVFFKTAQSLPAEGVMQAGVNVKLLTAISLGSVMMGAITYIGNGPNLMVKSIAEKSGVKMPSFFGYMLYSCSILLPLLLIMQLLFVR